MLFVLLIILGVNLCDARSYENYTLFRAIPDEKNHLAFLHNLSTYDANYWRMPRSLWMPVDFLIGPDHKEKFLMDAKKNGVILTTMINNIQSAFDNQTVKSYTRKRMETFGWQNYYPTNDIYEWMLDLSKAFPQEVQVFSIGKTYENRDILAAKVVLKGSVIRSKVIIEGGIHAREWISPSFVTYMLNQIIHSSKSANPVLRTLGRTYEWYFVPVLNPDGYEYTISKDRNWRKNRNGLGVDLNRNFAYRFGSVGVSVYRHSALYCGPKAFSEKESIAMSQFIRSKKNKLEYYISFHSYGQYIVIPYGNTMKHLDNYREVKEMGMAAAEKIKSLYGTTYTVGNAYETVGYKLSGSSKCWAKKYFDIPYSVTFELRDQGGFGFALPPNQIMPTCEETLAGVISFLTPRSKKYDPEIYKHDLLMENGGARSVNFSVVFVQLWIIILNAIKLNII